jgi:hypothetical protein
LKEKNDERKWHAQLAAEMAESLHSRQAENQRKKAKERPVEIET